MAKVQDLLVRILGDDADLAKALQSSERNLDAVGRRAERVGKDLTLKFTAPVVAAAAVAVKLGTDYDTVMTQIINLTGAAAEEVDVWRKSLLELAPQVGQTPRELARALLATLSAGAAASDALDIVTLSAKASAVGLGETADVAKVVTAALQAYGAQGLTAARATDVLIAGVREGAAEAPEFANALGRVLGQAAQLGVTFEEVVGFVAAYTRLGVSADEATTALVGTLSTVQSPTEEATKALAGMGLTVQDLRRSIVERGLAQTLVDLVQRARQTGTEIAAVIPNVRALAGVLGTAGIQGEAFLEITESMASSAGALDTAFERVSRTPAFTFAQLRANVEAVAIAIGEGLAPTLNELLQSMLPTLSILRSLDAQTIRTAAAVTGLAVAIPPLVYGFGLVSRTIASLLGVLTLLRGGVVATGALLGPGAAIATGLGLLVGLFIQSKLEALHSAIALAEFKSGLLALGDAARAELGIAKALQLDQVLRDLDEAKRKLAGFESQRVELEFATGGEVLPTREMREAQAEVARLSAAEARLRGELDAVNAVQRQAAEFTARTAEEQAKARAEAERLMAELSRMGQTSEDAAKKLRAPAKILEELEQKLSIAQKLGILSDAFDTGELSLAAYESALEELAEQLDATDPRVVSVRDRLEALRATIGGQAEILAEMNEQLATATTLGQLAGDSFNEQALKVGIYEEALRELIEAGLLPTDPAVRQVADALQVARQAAADAAAANEDLSGSLSLVASILEQARTPAEVFVQTMQAADLAVRLGVSSMEEYTRVLLDARATFDEATAAGESWEQQLAVGLVSAVTQFRLSFGGMAADVLKQIAQIIVRLGTMRLLMAGLSLFGIGAGSTGFLGAAFRIVSAPFGGGRAAGGPVSAGTVYRINEFGTESFVPSVPGRIEPARSAPSSSGPKPPIVFNVPPDKNPITAARSAELLRFFGEVLDTLYENGYTPPR